MAFFGLSSLARSTKIHHSCKQKKRCCFTWNIEGPDRLVGNGVDVVAHGDGGLQPVAEGNVDLADEELARVDDVGADDFTLKATLMNITYALHSG
jgi:hypothetical protein